MYELSKTEYAQAVCAALLDQNYFAAPGAGGRQDSMVSSAVMRAISGILRQPSGVRRAEVAPQVTNAGPLASPAFQQRLKTIYAAAAANEIDVAFLGETHRLPSDQRRVNDWIAAVASGTVATPTMVIRERGMDDYKTGGLGCPVVREGSLTTSSNPPNQYLTQYGGDWGFGLSVDQRSMVVAGYLAMCLGGSPQTERERVVILFGERHSAIVTQYLEYFIRHTASWVANRPRNYLVVSSTG